MSVWRGNRFPALFFCGLVAFGPGVRADDLTPALPRFQAVDTSRVMGSPDPLPPMGFERAFPSLRILRPVMPTHAGDGSNRMFVVTQEGRIYVFPNRRDVRRADVFLDIKAKVARPGGDNGMFAVAFHPRFKENGHLFIVYTTRVAPKSTVVSRFAVSSDDPNRADPDSEVEIIRIKQPFADHNAACLNFGPDGMLYIALGDGGYNTKNGNAQDRSTLLGAMLRIDVDHHAGDRLYSIPQDNPFIGKGGSRDEIWAYGLRAPWRFSFDRLTGDCWLGDNGQVEFEEIDLIQRGQNYGWMPREGFHAYDPSRVDPRGRPAKGRIPGRVPELDRGDGFTDPIVEYDHTQGKSVVGGFVYRGTRLPDLIGAYIYGDYVNGNIWALRWDGKRVLEQKLLARTRLKITSFGEDEAGELYFATFDGFINRLRPAKPTDSEETFPTKLSQTGLFESTPDLRPVEGMIPYSVNVPLWSDHADKERFVALPAAGSVTFSEDSQWKFPVGTVFVKTFFLETEHTRDLVSGLSLQMSQVSSDQRERVAANRAIARIGPRHRLASPASRERLETRLLVHNPRGWVGYTYRWNKKQTDAGLLGGALTATLDVNSNDGAENRSWYFPNRSDCMACHTRAAGFVLGMNTRQMNRAHDYGAARENQIGTLVRLGVFSEPLPRSPRRLPAWHDWNVQSGTIEERARAYLDVNCAMCHTPPGYTKIDLRFQTPLEQAMLLGRRPEKARVGPPDSWLIDPGHPERSELFLRMSRRGTGQMPNLATSVVDSEAQAVVAEWIRSLKKHPEDRN